MNVRVYANLKSYSAVSMLTLLTDVCHGPHGAIAVMMMTDLFSWRLYYTSMYTFAKYILCTYVHPSEISRIAASALLICAIGHRSNFSIQHHVQFTTTRGACYIRQSAFTHPIFHLESKVRKPGKSLSTRPRCRLPELCPFS